MVLSCDPNRAEKQNCDEIPVSVDISLKAHLTEIKFHRHTKSRMSNRNSLSVHHHVKSVTESPASMEQM